MADEAPVVGGPVLRMLWGYKVCAMRQDTVVAWFHLEDAGCGHQRNWQNRPNKCATRRNWQNRAQLSDIESNVDDSSAKIQETTDDEERSNEDMSAKKSPAKKSAPKALKVRTTPKKSFKSATFNKANDDNEELIDSLSIASLIDRGENFSFNDSHSWKRAGYLKTRIVDGEQYTYCVEFFVGYPITLEDEDFNVRLSTCGNFVLFPTKVPAWFGSPKHYTAELCAGNR
eukprot:scaffold4851_cov79-Cyclotella_meneghiniana.AAC.1